MATQQSGFHPIQSSKDLIMGEKYVEVMFYSTTETFSLSTIIIKGTPSREPVGKRNGRFVQFAREDGSTDTLSISDSNLDGQGAYRNHSVWPIEAMEFLKSLVERGDEGVAQYLAILNEHGMGKSASQSA